MFEDVRLFRRGIGEEQRRRAARRCTSSRTGAAATLALRPEGTASVVRAFVQHHPPAAVEGLVRHARRSATSAPRPGRYRQHHQLGVEVLGTDDPDVDVEVIALAADFYAGLGLRQVDLALNSMGDGDVPARPTSAAAGAYLGRARRRAVRRAPRALRGQPAAGPRLQATRVPGRHRGRAALRRLPRATPVPPTSPGCAPGSTRSGVAVPARPPPGARPRLLHPHHLRVRGRRRSTSAQNAVGGGGRYDGLAEASAGRRRPGIGFGIGIERLLLACDAEGVFAARPAAPRRLRGRRDRRRRGA